MQNSNLVTTDAFDGVIRDVAIDLRVSDKRIYEILGRDNPYVKAWRLFESLGRIAPERLELVRADFNARCDRLTRGRSAPSTVASLHRETTEAVQSIIDRAPRDVRRRHITEAIAQLQKQLDALDRVDEAGRLTLRRFGA
jgi:hypothetical protein